MKTIRIASEKINDWDSFHDVFANAFGFPGFYGCNMDAWIDCMSTISTPKHKGMTDLEIEAGEMVVIEMPRTESLRKRCPNIFAEMIDCLAIVNSRYIVRDEGTSLLLLLH